jgi:hypothetical protein
MVKVDRRRDLDWAKYPILIHLRQQNENCVINLSQVAALWRPSLGN